MSNYESYNLEETPRAMPLYNFPVRIDWSRIPSKLYLKNEKMFKRLGFLEKLGIELKLKKRRGIN